MSNFTPRAQQVLALSRKEADRFNHNYVGTEHLLLGLVRLGQGVAVNVLHKLGLDLEILRIEVEKQVGTGPPEKTSGNIPYTPRVKKVLALAGKEAKALNHSFVGTEHILLGLLREGDGASARVLKSLNVNIEETRMEILNELDPNFPQDPSSPTSQEINRVQNEINTLEEKRLEFVKAIGATTPSEESQSKISSPVLSPYLHVGETLLWSGAPKPKFRFGFKHLPIDVLVLTLGSLVLIPFLTLPEDTLVPVIAFVCIFIWVFYGWFGDPLSNRLALSRTTYGVTSQRVIAVIAGGRKIVRSYPLKSGTEIHLEVWPDGFGRIAFGSPTNSFLGKSAFFSRPQFSLEHIPEAAQVFRIISGAMTR